MKVPKEWMRPPERMQQRYREIQFSDQSDHVRTYWKWQHLNAKAISQKFGINFWGLKKAILQSAEVQEVAIRLFAEKLQIDIETARKMWSDAK